MEAEPFRSSQFAPIRPWWWRGIRNSENSIIGLEQTNNIELHRVRGEHLNPSTIHGFSARIKDSYFQMSPGAHTTMAIFKTQRLHDLAEIHGEEKLVDCLDRHNSLQLQPKHFKQLKTLLQPNNHTNEAFQETLIEVPCWNVFIQIS